MERIPTVSDLNPVGEVTQEDNTGRRESYLIEDFSGLLTDWFLLDKGLGFPGRFGYEGYPPTGWESFCFWMIKIYWSIVGCFRLTPEP